MNILFVDFETYYDGDFSLKDADSSAEYVMTTPIQLMGWALNNEPIQMAVGEEETKRVLSSIDWSTTALASHNIRFDGRLVHQRFGHNPVMYFDTMGFMAALRYDVVFGGLKLSHLAKILQGEGVAVLDKGEEVKEAKGKHLYQYPNGQHYLAAKEVSQDFIRTLNLTKSGKTKTGKAFKDPREFVAETISLFERFKEYCVNDVDICRKGFYFMVGKLPRTELAYQDMIARCALYPQLVMDLPMLKAAKHKAETSLRDAVRGVAEDWFDGDYAEAKAHLLSTGRLAILFKFMGGMTQDEVDDYIRTEGFDPEPPFIIPTKVSEKKSAKMGYTVYDYALAKKDDGMVKLSQLDYEPLQKVLAARKTAVYVNSYELPRLNRFINEQEAYGCVGMPLKVSGASTHRLGGELFNIQNLSSGRNDGQDATMRKSIMAPAGRVVVAADSSAVEARTLSYITNCKSQLDIFSSGGDIYCDMAGAIYNEDPAFIRAQHKAGNADYTYKRQMGKFVVLGCMAEDTGVLTKERGWVYIKNLESHHHLWDGKKWVKHHGLIYRGVKECVKHKGTYITPDHEVVDENNVWRRVADLVDDHSTSRHHTYDVAFVGDNSKFLVRGASTHEFFVHNCGYGMGGPGFKDQIFAQAKIFLETEEAQKLVQTYRNKYVDITNFWNQCNRVLKDMAAGGKGWFGGPDGKLFYYDGTIHIAGKRVPSIRLPDGLWLRYCELQMRERKYDDGTSKYAYCYYGIKEGRPTWIWTYGARLTENLCQSLAFAIMKWQAMNIHQRYPIAFNVHDEWVTTAPENEAQQAADFLTECMSQVPVWAQGCPIAAEAAFAQRYGDT